jgi:hypothetical protein
MGLPVEGRWRGTVPTGRGGGNALARARRPLGLTPGADQPETGIRLAAAVLPPLGWRESWSTVGSGPALLRGGPWAGRSPGQRSYVRGTASGSSGAARHGRSERETWGRGRPDAGLQRRVVSGGCAATHEWPRSGSARSPGGIRRSAQAVGGRGGPASWAQDSHGWDCPTGG